MPELPEVEVVREGLARHLLGFTVREPQVLDARSVRRHVAGVPDFLTRLTGARILDVARRGKYLWIHLSRADAPEILPEALVVHLGMSGQALIKPAGAPDEKHLRIRLVLDPPRTGSGPEGSQRAPLTDEVRAAGAEGLELRFVDQRIFGGMFVEPTLACTDPAGHPVPAASTSVLGLDRVPASVAHIARDPLDPHFDDAAFRARVLRTDSGIKRVLLDQTIVSGVGNIYADEALWRARVHYARPARTLSATGTRDLLAACREVMTESLAQGGTSFDALYVNVNGESGYFARGLSAYGRAGEPCLRCAATGRPGTIVREPFMNRSSYRCTWCQRRPRGI